MPRGFWDWGVNPAGVSLSPEINNAELAARLGSIVTYDRRGELVFADGFEGGLARWQISGFGAGTDVALSTSRVRTGGFAALLTAGNDPAGTAIMTHDEVFPEVNRFGLQCFFQLPAAISSLDLILQLLTGSQLVTFRLRWDDVANELQYFNSSGVATALATGVSLSTAQTLFHALKFVADGVEREYVRAILDGTTYSMADIAAQVTADASLPLARLRVSLNGGIAANDQLYLDDVIFTHNEP